MKKIVMLLSAPLAHDQRVIKEATSLISHNYDVKIIGLSRKSDCRQDSGLFDQITLETVPLKAIGYSSSIIPYLILFNLIAFVKLVISDFDIVHCNDFDTLVAGFFAGKLRRKKIVYDSHEYYAVLAKVVMPKLAVSILYAVENALSRRVNGFITVNDKLAGIFVNRGVKKNKVAVVMNCKDPVEFQVDDVAVKSLRKKLGAENKFIVLFDGWLWSNYGLEELITATAKLGDSIEDLLVVIVGNGYLEKDLKKMVDQLGVTKYVRFIGQVPLRAIPLYVNACDVMYLSYKKVSDNNVIATPNRLFEAIICGKPLIVGNFGYIRELVEKERFGVIIDPENIDELSLALKRMRYDEVFREDLGKRAKQLSKAYNWQFMEKRMLNLYDGL